MKITVKSPIGTEIEINLAANTATIQKIGMVDAPIQDWGTTHHEGENVQYIQTDGKQIIIDADCFRDLTEARADYQRSKLEEAVPGITLLQAAMRGEAGYFAALNEMMDDEMGVSLPNAPALNVEELKAEYPRAALYAKADAYSEAAHYAKSAAGNKAKKLLEEGGSKEEAKAILASWNKDVYID